MSTTDGLFPIAAIWDRWEREGETLDSVALVTTEPNELTVKVHNRMPVILADDDVETWMKGDVKAAAKLMKPFPAERMTMHPVSTFVSNAWNQGERCIEPIEIE